MTNAFAPAISCDATPFGATYRWWWYRRRAEEAIRQI